MVGVSPTIEFVGMVERDCKVDKKADPAGEESEI